MFDTAFSIVCALLDNAETFVMLSSIPVSGRKGLLAGWCDRAPIEEIFLWRSELKCTPHTEKLPKNW
jgi:hypothetical protein